MISVALGDVINAIAMRVTRSKATTTISLVVGFEIFVLNPRQSRSTTVASLCEQLRLKAPQDSREYGQAST